MLFIKIQQTITSKKEKNSGSFHIFESINSFHAPQKTITIKL